MVKGRSRQSFFEGIIQRMGFTSYQRLVKTASDRHTNSYNDKVWPLEVDDDDNYLQHTNNSMSCLRRITTRPHNVSVKITIITTALANEDDTRPVDCVRAAERSLRRYRRRSSRTNKNVQYNNVVSVKLPCRFRRIPATVM